MKSPLHKIHKELGAKFTDFHGWQMPLNYKGIIDEVKAVRQGIGVFDISHMGRFFIRGEKVWEKLQLLTTNDLRKLYPGRVQYNLITNPQGGVKDDITLYMLSENEFFMCVNAANREKVKSWLSEYIDVEDISDRTVQIAVQGRDSTALLGKYYDVKELKYYHFKSFENTIVSRTGYTGEVGFEVYTDLDSGAELFTELVKRAQPCGLGARDILRIEAGFPLYGNELSESITPIEAGLERFVSFEKEFMGKEAILKKKSERRLVKLTLTEKGIPRKGYKILSADGEVGFVTSGTYSPTLNTGIAMGFVNKGVVEEGSALFVEIRGKKIKAEPVKSFLKRR